MGKLAAGRYSFDHSFLVPETQKPLRQILARKAFPYRHIHVVLETDVLPHGNLNMFRLLFYSAPF